jgi:hypothetical protein
MSADHRVDGALVGAAKGLGRVRQRRQRLRASQFEEQLGPELGRQRLAERTVQRGDRRIRRALRECGARGRLEDVDDPFLPTPRHRHDVGRDVFGARVQPEQEPCSTVVAQLPLPGREVAVDGGLDERMDEAERRVGSEDLGPHELSPGCGEGLAVEPRQRADDGQLRPIAENGE